VANEETDSFASTKRFLSTQEIRIVVTMISLIGNNCNFVVTIHIVLITAEIIIATMPVSEALLRKCFLRAKKVISSVAVRARP